MAANTRRILREVRGLIPNRRFSKALEKLNTIDASRLCGFELGEFCILRAKASLFEECSKCVGEDIDTAIEVFRPGADTRRFAEAKYLRGRWLSEQSRFVEAKQDLLEAHTSYLRCGDHAGSAAALSRLSYAHLMTGEMTAAIQNQEEAVRVYSRIGASKNRIACAQTLYVYYLKAGRLTDSLSGFKLIASEVSDLGDRSQLIYYFNHALSLAAQGRIAEARKTIDKCRPFLESYPRMRGIYYENLGFINILGERYKAAERALKAGLEVANSLDSAHALIAQIKRLFGDLYVATQQWDKAEQYTREGLKVAEKIGERIEIAACQRIFARIENHRGNTDKAREWFRKAIELFGVIGANYELAVTRYLAGVSGLYQNGERQAFLWMAREYFAEEEVKPYLEKVDVALAGGGPPHPVSKDNAPTIIAGSKAINDLVLRADNIASADMTILLTGPTGTGKDLFARYIHAVSGRKGEFVPVNAAAIPNDLVEAELFGHTKGAFTGATECRTGLIEQADNGTLYLNEIADASPQLQAKLLEVIETKEVRALGGNGSRPVSVRIIAATNHDLQQRIADGHFRADLYHRLNEIPIHLPPLSERREDIPALVEYFLGCGGCSCRTNGNAESIERLGFLFSILDYPGNVRELKYRVEELAMRSGGDIGRMVDLLLGADYLSEREWLERVLERTGWNRSQAARCLGLAESTVRKRIRRYSLSTVNS